MIVRVSRLGGRHSSFLIPHSSFLIFVLSYNLPLRSSGKVTMQRILLVVIVLLVVWRILASIGRRLSERAPGADSYSRFSPEARRRRKRWTDGGDGSAEELVECVSCGTFVPIGRSLSSGNGAVYCSRACQGTRTGPSGDASG